MNKLLILLMMLYHVGFSKQIDSLFIMMFLPDRNTPVKLDGNKVSVSRSTSGSTVYSKLPFSDGEHMLTYYKNGQLTMSMLVIDDGWYSFKKFDPEDK